MVLQFALALLQNIILKVFLGWPNKQPESCNARQKQTKERRKIFCFLNEIKAEKKSTCCCTACTSSAISPSDSRSLATLFISFRRDSLALRSYTEQGNIPALTLTQAEHVEQGGSPEVPRVWTTGIQHSDPEFPDSLCQGIPAPRFFSPYLKEITLQMETKCNFPFNRNSLTEDYALHKVKFLQSLADSTAKWWKSFSSLGPGKHGTTWGM